MLYFKIMEVKDLRIKVIMEILKNMRVFKLYFWEIIFMGKFLILREFEKLWLSKYFYICLVVVFLFWVLLVLVFVVIFGVCIIIKMLLILGTVLFAFVTFRIL